MLAGRGGLIQMAEAAPMLVRIAFMRAEAEIGQPLHGLGQEQPQAEPGQHGRLLPAPGVYADNDLAIGLHGPHGFAPHHRRDGR